MSSVERAFRRSPSIVSTHFERKRVSNENSPVGSVAEASMSPRSSLTTNVFPSRILTTPALIVRSRRSPSDGRRPSRRRHGGKRGGDRQLPRALLYDLCRRRRQDHGA